MVPAVSVIIPTRNRPADLRRCLHALAECSTGALAQVIIVDDCSRPRVSDVYGPPLPIELVRLSQPRGATGARAVGVHRARARILAFLDDDALPRADWLDVIVDSFEGDRAAITGRVLPFDAGLMSRARQARYMRRYHDLEPGRPVTFFAGGNGAVLRQTFLDVGGMVGNGPGADNSLVLNLARAGLRVHFVPPMVVVHRNGKGLRTAVREAFGSGRHHPDRMGFPDLVVQSLRPGAGDALPERAVNSALNVVHLVGRHHRMTKRPEGGAS
jgi:glycosyltransferase involved in cell wall biosynthesis